MSKQFTAYAPPMAWGVWHTIESHGGSIARTITYEPIGDTVVKGKVKYFKFEGEVVEEEFKDKVSIKTADVWANIEVSFKAMVTGSTVQGEIS